MAAQVFPTTVYVTGFPAKTSRQLLLKMFGGYKGYIQEIQFTNTPGEPKKAFITYNNVSSVPKALRMTGKRIFDHPETLDVRQVDEAILREHVPGGERDSLEALQNLQTVLGNVLDEKDIREEMHRLEVSRLNTRTSEATNELGKLQMAFLSYKEERERTYKDLTTQLTDRQAEVVASGQRVSQAQAESAALRTSLAESESRLKTAQECIHAQEEEMKDLQGRLRDTISQKESAMERLGIANNKVATLEQDIKALKYEYYETRSALRRAQISLDDADDRLRMEETRANTADGKRARTEEWLADEREAKHRLVLDFREMEARHETISRQVESGYVERLEVLRRRLKTEMQGKQQAEEQLAQANLKLDKGIVTDALLEAFIKLENWGVRVLGDVPPSV